MTERPYEGKIIVAQLFFEFSPGDYSHLNIFKKGPKRQIYRSFEEEKKTTTTTTNALALGRKVAAAQINKETVAGR
jgi:hypothetical protein